MAFAVVEISKGSSHLSDREVKNFYDNLEVPDIIGHDPRDFINPKYKFAFVAGYPAKVFRNNREQFADYKMYADIGEIFLEKKMIDNQECFLISYQTQDINTSQGQSGSALHQILDDAQTL